MAAQFTSEGATLSGVDLELVGSGYRLSLVKRRFATGTYRPHRPAFLGARPRCGRDAGVDGHCRLFGKDGWVSGLETQCGAVTDRGGWPGPSGRGQEGRGMCLGLPLEGGRGGGSCKDPRLAARNTTAPAPSPCSPAPTGGGWGLWGSELRGILRRIGGSLGRDK